MNFRGFLRLVIVNIAVFVGLMLGVLFLASAVSDVYNLAKYFISKKDKRAYLPAYYDPARALKIFDDQKANDSEYIPFVEWRQKPYKSTMLNVDDEGNRVHTRNRNAGVGVDSIGFFGSSVIWGTGVADDETIPAAFDNLTEDFDVKNYGERGHTSLQNLIQLIMLLNQNVSPKVVVFYVGAADVWTHCNLAVTERLNGHMEEHKIRYALNRIEKRNYLYNNLVEPIIALLSEVFSNDDKVNIAGCSTNLVRASEVAETIVRNLEMAQQLAVANGGQFYAFLQPTIFQGNPRSDYLELRGKDLEFKKEVNSIYPILIEKTKSRNHWWFHDLSGTLDGEQFYYTDYAHLNAAGNMRIAEAIRKIVNSQ